MVARIQTSTEEGRLVTERVKALQKQIDEQQGQHRQTEQNVAAAMDKERGNLRAAGHAANQRHRGLEQELTASVREAEAIPANCALLTRREPR